LIFEVVMQKITDYGASFKVADFEIAAKRRKKKQKLFFFLFFLRLFAAIHF